MDQPINPVLSNTTQKKAPLPGGTTPVPNGLLDAVMPTLRDTELRVLLVVVRQTLGWQDGPGPAGRKERDWLTQSQLMGRTGRGSGAVAHAVDALVQAGLIEVQDRAGTPLGTPAERRRHLGRLYYRLRPGEQGAGGAASTKTTRTEHAKAHTTKETDNKNIRLERENVDKPVDNFRAHDSVQQDRVKKGQVQRGRVKKTRAAQDSPLAIRTDGWERATRPHGPAA